MTTPLPETDSCAQTPGVLDDARFVSERATHVSIDPAAVARVAEDFLARAVPVPAWNAELHFTDGTPRTANYLFVLDGLNFSFWGEPRWGIDYRGASLRGYWALAASLKRAIEEGHPVDDADWMATADAETLAQILRGRGTIPLFETRLATLNTLGRQLKTLWGGQFANAITSCNGSALALTRLLVRDFPSFDDASPYAGRRVKLLKRAQILPADLYGAFGGQGLGHFHDIGSLTAFADYKVPQILEKLGIMRYAPALDQKIMAGVEIAKDSAEEVEIRAVTLWAVELLQRALAERGRTISAIEVDWILWEMGLHMGPNDKPYHLTRTTSY